MENSPTNLRELYENAFGHRHNTEPDSEAGYNEGGYWADDFYDDDDADCTCD